LGAAVAVAWYFVIASNHRMGRIQVATDQSHIVILRKPRNYHGRGMIDHELIRAEDIFMRHDDAFGLHRGTGRVLEEQYLRVLRMQQARNRIDEVFRGYPRKAGDVIHIDAGGRNTAPGKIGLERSMVVTAGQDACRLAVLCNVDHLVQGTLKATRTWRIDRHGDKAGAHTAEEGADHFKARWIGKQKPVARMEATIFTQMSSDRFRPMQKRSVGIALDRISVYVKVRIKELVRVLICQPVQVV
jgi:hypothetical protein